LTRFQNSWFAIDQSAYQKLTDKRLNTKFGKQLVAQNMEFLDAILKSGKSFLRDDYKECAELSFLVLGGVPSAGFVFKACGANHHARWMSKVIYSLKMYLFRLGDNFWKFQLISYILFLHRSEFRLKKDEENNLKELCLFFSLIYVKKWLEAPDTLDAPFNDLNFIEQLENYRVINKTISQKALKKISNHLWYISPELVPLALFSSKVKFKFLKIKELS
jgi:hypothetical protein